MAFDRFDFELDREGPRFRVGLWERRAKRKAKSLAERIGEAIEELDVQEHAADLAAAGQPAVDSDQPCSFERRIRARLHLILDEVAAAARAELRANGGTLAALGTDLIDSTYQSNEASLDGQLATVETDLAATLPGPMRTLVECETRLARFNEKHRTANEPAGRSPFMLFVTTMAASIFEAMLNTALFRGEMGIGPGAQFAATVGVALACIGTMAGFGASRLQKEDWKAKVGGALILGTSLALGCLLLLKIGEFRASMAHAPAHATSLAILEPGLLPYAILNLFGVVFVAWKALPVFAYRGLKALREEYAEARDLVARIISEALKACEKERTDARGGAEGIARTAQANAGTAHELASCEHVIERFEDSQERLSDAVVATEYHFREVIARVHPEGGSHVRFKNPPERFTPVKLSVDEHFAAIAKALEARSVAMRDELPAALARIDQAANNAKERISERVPEIEAEARSSRGSVHNIFRFRAKEAAA